MSYRSRTMLLLALVAVTASLASGWLASRFAADRVRDVLVADRGQQREIVDTVREYGLVHGTWDGVDDAVAGASASTGQRIRLEDLSGRLLADSDLLSGAAERGLVGDPVTLRVEPPLRLGGTGPERIQQALGAYYAYRGGIPYAACLTRQGVGVRLSRDDSGIPSYVPVGATAGITSRCAGEVPVAQVQGDVLTLNSEFARCPSSQVELEACLATMLDGALARVAPAPLRLYVGAVSERPVALPVGQIAGAVILVAALVLLAGSLLARRVVGPVEALAAAATRLGRLPATPAGSDTRDELVRLDRAFSAMSQSLADAELRQRQLLADISHELRTPLANIRGHLEAVGDGLLALDDEVMASMLEEVEHQGSILDDLRDLTAATDGALRHELQAVDVTRTLEAVASAHAGRAQACGVSVTVTSPDALPTLWADPGRLRQVLSNYLSNAIRAAAAGGGHVLVQAEHRGDEVELRVVDDGPGVAEADLAHVFERFWRADPARQRSTGGSGLGLAVAKAIVEAHGGTVGVRRGDRGAVFVARIPYAAPPGGS